MASLPVGQRVWKSTKLWSMYADLEESLGSMESTQAVYERMIELKVVTPQIMINYAHLLEESKHFEDSFRVYEKGVNAFEWPLSKELWIAYLSKFVQRYEGKKMERARDLFEQAITKIPAEETRPIYLMYAQLEEDHGLVKNAMCVWVCGQAGVRVRVRVRVRSRVRARERESARACVCRWFHVIDMIAGCQLVCMCYVCMCYANSCALCICLYFNNIKQANARQFV